MPDDAPEMARVEQGAHLCLFYDDDPAEQMPALVPFLRAGLENQERCIYVADDQTTDQLAAHLRAAGIDVEHHLQSGGLLLWSRDQWRQPGELSSPAKRLQVQEIIDEALSAGFRGIRFAVEMTWTLGPDIDVALLQHWEATINEIFRPEVPARIVCQYSRRRLKPSVIRAGLATHPAAVMGTAIAPNPYYEAPLLLEHKTEDERVEWMIAMLRRAAGGADLLPQPRPLASHQVAGLYAEAGAIAERLRDSEEDLRDFFENGSVGLHWVGPDGTVLRVNRAELKMLGYTEEEYVGRHISDFHINRGAIEDILRRLRAGETLQDYPAEMRCKDGSAKQVLIDSSVLWRNGEFIHTRCFTRDVTRERAGVELASRLGAIVDSSEDAIVSKDLRGVIQSWNTAAQRMFGYTPEEAVGQSVRMLIPPERQDEEDDVLAALRKGERIEHYETIRLRKDGSPIEISLTVSPVYGAGGRVVGASKIARDITVRKEAERAIARSLKLKDEFVSLVSHELRTPISIVVGNGRLLLRREGELSKEQAQQALEDLVSNAERLEGTIENLLLLNRMERSQEVLVEPLYVQRVAAGVVESFRTRESGREVALGLPEDTSLALGEPGLLSLVLENLLSNASKYSPEGSTIELVLGETGDGCVELHVLDRGIGIDPEDAETVFNAFYRAPSARTRAPGMGLGLAVCQRAMQAQGGEIAARPREGGGSDFVLRLPAAKELL